MTKNGWQYPKKQINGADTPPVSIQYLDLIITELSEEQNKGYDYVVEKEKEKYPILNNPESGIQYTVIDGLQQSLNIIYPVSDDEIKKNIDSKALYGKTGLGRTLTYNIDEKQKDFQYTQNVIDNYGRIFSSEGGDNAPLKKYSAKIYSIINTIKNSKGIVLIYSNYINGGCIPIALALEEIGIRRYGDAQKSLFSQAPVPDFQITGKSGKKTSAKYVMITGDPNYSGVASNKSELKACTDSGNVDGEKVKVIIISKAGTEGLDFKNIRQVHILEPWFNLNRADQTIGRAVRNKSHCDLPFNERTVQVFLYGSQLKGNITEAIDLYVYRLAEYKSIKIGKVSKVLKENSVDCIINKNQKQMLQEKLNKKVKLLLSTGEPLNFDIGHKNYSFTCDFMECDYQCNPDNSKNNDTISNSSYSKGFIVMNIDKILKRIKDLFKEHYVYEKTQLINRIRAVKPYSDEQIYMAIDILLDGKHHLLTDMINRTGKLINIGDFYLFQPINIEDEKLTVFERRNPNKFKHQSIIIKNFKKPRNQKETYNDTINHLDELKDDYEIAITPQDKLTSAEKRIWEKSSGKTINNLVKYNKMDRGMLEEFCLEHLFDIKSINTKLNIINNLEKEKDSNDGFIKKLNEIVNKYKFNEYLFLPDYSKEYNSPPATDWELLKQKLKMKKNGSDSFFKFDEETKTYKNYIGYDNVFGKLAGTIRKPLRSVENFFEHDINKINNFIGFMSIKNSKDKSITFKTKDVKKSKNERINKGILCPSKGVGRQERLDSINSLIINGINYPEDCKTNKYILEKKPDKKRPPIYILLKNNEKQEIPLNDISLCVEIEFLLRHLDKIKHNGKKYFFSTIEDVFCGGMSEIEKKIFTDN